MLVVRAIGGNVLYSEAEYPDATMLQGLVLSNAYNSILGDREKARGTFKEFVLFDADQLYVEYTLFYKREYADGGPPAPVRTSKATPISTRGRVP